MNGKLRLSRVYSSLTPTTWTEIPNQNSKYLGKNIESDRVGDMCERPLIEVEMKRKKPSWSKNLESYLMFQDGL